jgi:hypothetical protein
MARRPKERAVVRDFSGLEANVDAHDIEAGAGRVQVNAASEVPGELRARRGLRFLDFDDPEPGSSG